MVVYLKDSHLNSAEESDLKFWCYFLWDQVLTLDHHNRGNKMEDSYVEEQKINQNLELEFPYSGLIKESLCKWDLVGQMFVD